MKYFLLFLLASTALGQAPLKSPNRALDQDRELCVNDGGVIKCLTIDGPTAEVTTPGGLTVTGNLDVSGNIAGDINLNGNELFLYSPQQSIEGDGSSFLKFKSNQNMVFSIDRNDAGADSFSFVTGSGETEIANIDKSGDMTLNGDLTTDNIDTLVTTCTGVTGANVDTFGACELFLLRINNVVTVSGRVTFATDNDVVGDVTMAFNLPVGWTSNFTDALDAAGSVGSAASNNSYVGQIYSEATNDRITIFFDAPGMANSLTHTARFSGSYEIK